MKNLLKTVLFILGAPVILGMIAYSSILVYTRGISYGFWPFAGSILAGVFCIVFIITFIITGRSAKKKANKKSIFKGTIALATIAFIFSAGLWLIIDIPLPGILQTATSGTVLFDDLREDYKYKAEEHGDILDKFVMMNYDIHNLEWKEGTYSEAEREAYIKEGYRNPRIKALIRDNFKSIDQNGYASFKGPWISFADEGRMTLPTLIHLVLNQREEVVLPYLLEYDVSVNPYVSGARPDNLIIKGPRADKEGKVNWTVLDMQGGEMAIQIGDILRNAGFENQAIKLLMPAIDGMVKSSLPNVLEKLNEALATPAVTGSNLYLQLNISDLENPKLAIVSATESRGMHGYMHSAWLNSNNLLFAVISIFPARQWLYILGSWLIFTSVAVGAIRYSQYAKDKDDSVSAAPAVQQRGPQRGPQRPGPQGPQGPYGPGPQGPQGPYGPGPQGPNPHQGYYPQEMNPNYTPYERSYMAATRDRNQRLH